MQQVTKNTCSSVEQISKNLRHEGYRPSEDNNQVQVK